MSFADFVPVIGSALGGLFGSSEASKNRKMQKEFAQNGIRWRVQDAQKAGIHPLYALGAQVTPFSPVQVGDGGFTQMGQDLGRALTATRTQGERVDAYTKAAQALNLQKTQAEIDLIKANTARALAPESQAPFPGSSYLIPGQTQSGLVQDGPMQRAASIATGGGPFSESGRIEPGSVSDVGYARTATGYAPIPSMDVKNRIEDNFLAELQWMFRNQVQPMFGSNKAVPFKAPAGMHWVFTRGEYRLKSDRELGREGVKGW